MTTLAQDLVRDHDFRERHRRRVAAPPEAVWRALTEVTLSDLRAGRLLVALRHLGDAGGSRPSGPLLTDGPVRLLQTDPPRYALAGSVGQPWRRRPISRPVESIADFVAVDEPGWVTYLTDFRLEPAGDGTELITETRGRSTDRGTARRFAIYWALIRPWSGLIRRELLAAVARRAESETV